MEQKNFSECLRKNAIMKDAIERASKDNPKAFMVIANLDSDHTFVVGQGSEDALVESLADVVTRDERIAKYFKKALIVKSLHDFIGGDDNE